MPRKAKPRDARQQADDKLDETLENTFPASDPVALIQPAPKKSDEPPRAKGQRRAKTST
jgi:hypothetical protein